MKQKPKKFHKKKEIIQIQSTKQESKFPSISRIIPEHLSFILLLRRPSFWLNVISGILVMIMILFVLVVKKDYETLLQMREKKADVMQDFAYWQGIVATHPGYRDGYFRLAVFSYRLGNNKDARGYLSNSLLSDPLFQPALALQRQL